MRCANSAATRDGGVQAEFVWKCRAPHGVQVRFFPVDGEIFPVRAGGYWQ